MIWGRWRGGFKCQGLQLKMLTFVICVALSLPHCGLPAQATTNMVLGSGQTLRPFVLSS